LAGIYIHIPYCRKACYYCNFHFSTSLKSSDDTIKAISTELSHRKKYISKNIDTIYFGGGTPSLLNTSSIGYLLNQINKYFNIDANAEITLEANPEDINKAKVSDYSSFGINRVSLGVQSFDDQILKSLNRQHSGIQALDAVEILKNEGVENISIDLIYGIPGQGNETWQMNLSQAVELEIQHISSYALTIEDKTAFGHWQKAGKIHAVEDVKYNDDYNIMCKTLAIAGYTHYEVSNFSKAGFESKHNTSYWQQEDYLGLGPGAHSYNGINRQFNISNNATYINAIKNGDLPFEEEVLSESQLFNEHLLTCLRTNQGINFSDFERRFGVNLYDQHKKFIDQCLQEKLAKLVDGQFILTDAALILADSVIIEMMIEE